MNGNRECTLPIKRKGRRAAPVAEPRRAPQQERGERRVDELLDAAAAVIARVGIEAATTNAIAEEAGASVGSLYHFFPNKDAIIRALASRYDATMRAINQAAMGGQAILVPIPQMVEGIVSPLAAFMEANPAYLAVYNATSDPRHPGCLNDDLHQTIIGLVEGLMAARVPDVPPATRRMQASFAVQLVHRMLEYAWSAPPAERPAIVRELKRVLALHSEMIAQRRDPLTDA
jgi:AcrR family transcriptional regulator